MKDNAEQLKRRQRTLENAGAFRVQLPKTSFQRGFTPKFGAQVYKVDSISGGQVKSGNKSFSIARVLPVPAGSSSSSASAPRAEAKLERRTTELRQYADALRDFLKDGKKGLASVGTFLRDQEGFTEKFTQLRLNRPGGMREAVLAVAPDIRITAGPGQPFVSLAPRPTRRLRGKQGG